MKISVLINGKAGRANASVIRSVVDRALFRAEISYFEPTSAEGLQALVLAAAKTSEALIICGGDGTLNTAIQPLMSELMKPTSKFVIPPILPLPVGTANDLASELGVSRRLERAARLVFETKPKSIDVIEVKSIMKTVYMLTNGGIGIAAETANLANEVREKVSQASQTHGLQKMGRRLGREVVSLAGSRIYEILLAGQLISGQSSKWLEGWSLSIEIDGGIIRETTAPFVMVNNQPGLGGKYVPAPLTSNTDGTFNILLVDTPNIFSQARALWKIRAGKIPDENTCPRLETRRAIFRAHDSCRDLTFFGDGEILQSAVREIELTCLKRALPVFVGGDV